MAAGEKGYTKDLKTEKMVSKKVRKNHKRYKGGMTAAGIVVLLTLALEEAEMFCRHG